MTPLERAARAAREAENKRLGNILPPWEDSTDEMRDAWRGIALAVFETIREPSEAMKSAGWLSDLPFTPSIKVDVVWQAMIEAALSK